MQLDVGHAELAQVGDLLDQPGEGSRVLDAARGMTGEAADMELVDDGPVEPARLDAREPRRHVRHEGPQRRVPGLGGIGGPAAVPGRVAHGARPRVEQVLARIEAPAGLLGVLRTVHPPRVAGARGQAFDEHVPEVEGSVRLGGERDHLERLGRVRRLEQQQLDARGVAAVDAEVDPAVARAGARREARSGAGCVVAPWPTVSRARS